MTKKNIIRIIRRIFLWALGITVVLLTTVQILLTPHVLTPFIEKYASSYVDADVDFGKVSVNVFRNFPNISVSVDSCLVTYSSGKFADILTRKGLMRSSLRGCSRDTTGTGSDTLATMAEFRASVNPFALLHNQLRIKQISVTDLKGYAHRYDTSCVNWNILVGTDSPEDTTDTGLSGNLPVPVIGRITLTGRPVVIYSDEVSKTVAMASFSSFDFKGNRGSGKNLMRDFSLKIDSLFVFGGMSEDSAAISLEKIRLMSTDDCGVAGEVSARLFSLSKDHGRIHFPVDFSFSADLPSEKMDTVSVKSFEGDFCGLPFCLKGEAARSGDSIYVDASFDIKNGDIGSLSEEYGSKFIDILKQISTDALMDIHAEAKGFWSQSAGTLPDFKIGISVPKSSIVIDGSDTASFWLRCHADNVSRGRVNLYLDTLSLAAMGSSTLRGSGKLLDILGKDPLIHLDLQTAADLSPFSDKFGSDTTFRVEGNFEGDLKGDVRMSQLKLPDVWSANLGARFRASGLKLRMPSDSMDIWSDTVKFVFGAISNEYLTDFKKGGRILSAGASVDSAFIRIKDELEISVNALKIRCHNDATLALNLLSGRIPQYSADISAARLSVMDSDSSRITLRGTQNTIKLTRKERYDSIPSISLSSSNRFFLLSGRSGRLAIAGLNLYSHAEKRTGSRIPRPGQRTGQRPNLSKEKKTDDFSSSDIDFSLGESFKKFYREWIASGSARFRSARISSPKFPLKTRASGFGVSFSNNSFSLDSLSVRTGETSVSLNGKISGLRRALLTNGTATADFSMVTDQMDINELLAAAAVGSATESETVVNDEDNPEKTSEEILTSAEELSSPLIVIPKNLEATINLDGRNISVSNMVIDSLSTTIEMRNRCLRVSHITAGTNIGDMSFEGFYATKAKDDISVGMNLGLSRITAHEVISMLPSVDTLMPLLKSFDGELDCYLAFTSYLDTNMNLIPPTMTGVLRFGGRDLSLGQSSEIRKITRMLMFKNKNDFGIEQMSVEALLHNSQVEVFPFILNIDRYCIAASGIQNLNESCRYHVSVIKSPLPFRIGLDIYGDDFDKLHYKLVKPKYKSEEKIPVFSSTIDETRLNLSRMISDIFNVGVEKVTSDSTFLEQIQRKKDSISYVSVQDSKSEALSDSEISRMRSEAEKKDE